MAGGGTLQIDQFTKIFKFINFSSVPLDLVMNYSIKL